MEFPDEYWSQLRRRRLSEEATRLVAEVRAALPRLARRGATAAIGMYAPSYYDDNVVRQGRSWFAYLNERMESIPRRDLRLPGRKATDNALESIGALVVDEHRERDHGVLITPGSVLFISDKGSIELEGIADEPARSDDFGPLTAPPAVQAWLRGRADAIGGIEPFLLMPDAYTWSELSAHERLAFEERLAEADSAARVWFDAMRRRHGNPMVALERIGDLAVLSYDMECTRIPVALVRLAGDPR